MRRPSRRAWYLCLIAAVPLGLLAASGIVWQASYSAFTATATNGANPWSAGTVTLTATPSTAVFTAAGLKPGSNGTACVAVNYTGSLPAGVRLYLKASDLTGTGLGQYLTFQVNEGTGAASDCSDFVSSANDYNPTGMTDTTKTLSGFSAQAHDYGTGVSAWSTTVTTTKTFQFKWQLQDTNSAQGLAATATFTWEADST